MAREWSEQISAPARLDFSILADVAAAIGTASNSQARLFLSDSMISDNSVTGAVGQIALGEHIVRAELRVFSPEGNPWLNSCLLKWSASGPVSIQLRGTDHEALGALTSRLRSILDSAPDGEPPDSAANATPGSSLSGSESRLTPRARQSLEAVFTYWAMHAEEMGADLSDLELGDKLVAGTNVFLTHDDPPKSVLKSVLGWFGHKADLFIETAVKSAAVLAPAVVAHRMGVLDDFAKLVAASKGELAGP